MRLHHGTRPVQVWVDVDVKIAEAVEWLNTWPGVRTFASCQGTLGESGLHPYRPQVMAYWPEEITEFIEKRFEIGERGDGWAYLHPRQPVAVTMTEREKLHLLTVQCVNISSPELVEVSTYRSTVSTNGKVIWQGKIVGHRRSEGWTALLRKVADEGEIAGLPLSANESKSEHQEKKNQC